jgi:outer membrane protein assembly factor BamB
VPRRSRKPGLRPAAAALLALAVPALLAACGGGGGGPASDTSPTQTAPRRSAAMPSVRVVDGDLGEPIAGATVLTIGAKGARLRAGADGRVEVPRGTRVVRVQAAGHDPARAAVAHRGETVVRLWDPALQSPQYGGGPRRIRFVPQVKAGPPSGAPDWSFDGRTLLEFPPAVDKGFAIVGTNSGRVFALDIRDGAVRWARRLRGYIAATPAIAGDRVYVASMDGTLTCYRLADGVALWQFSTGGSPIESSPLVVDSQLYFGAWNGKLYSIDIRTAKLRWTFQAPADIKGSAALNGDMVVVGDYAGQVHGVSRATGHEVWRFTGGRRFYGGPAVADGKVVIGDVGGAVLALNAQDGNEIWRHSTGGQYVYSSPAVADGVVYIGSYNGAFQALDLETGAQRWSYDVGGRISGSATVVNGIVYTAVLAAPGQPKRTWGLDIRNGRVRYQGSDGRYSPAVGAGRTLYLVGSRRLYAYRAGAP